MILEQSAQAFAGAARVACEHDFVACAAQVTDMLRYRFVDVRLLRSLGREVAG